MMIAIYLEYKVFVFLQETVVQFLGSVSIQNVTECLVFCSFYL